MKSILKITVFACLVIINFGCAHIGFFGKPSFSSKNNYIKANPNLTSEIKEAILSATIVEGMSKEDVLVSVGKPDYIVGEERTHGLYDEDWYYDASVFAFHQRRYIRFGLDKSVVFDNSNIKEE